MGDALGYPVEFQQGPEILRRVGAAAPAKLNYDGGKVARVSDDTQMTLFTAEGVVRALQRGRDRGICHAPTVLAFALLRWYETQGGRASRSVSRPGWLITEKRLHDQRAPGTTCMSALGQLREADLPTVDAPPNDSKGCGAVMRVAPCGLAAGTREQAFELARDSGVLTHGHPSGYLSAAYFASLIWDLARGTSLPDAMVYADDLLAPEKGKGELVRILARTQKLAENGPPDMQTIEALGGGWTGEEALAIAHLCALTFDKKSSNAVEGALWHAAAHSGDSDSTAAITGNLLGAMLGAGGLPKSWLTALELKDVIERIATDLHQAAILGKVLDFDAYPPN
jgi:ADP-ribosylglycohydrolase